MSGYRSLHREQVLPRDDVLLVPSDDDQEQDTTAAPAPAIWSCQATPLLLSSASSPSEQRWRIWTASSDGGVRSYVAAPPSRDDEDSLNASALHLHCSHLLTSKQQQQPSRLGCSVVHAVRNYAGEDDDAGDLVLACLELAGTVRLWKFAADWDDATATNNNAADPAPPKSIPCRAEFVVKQATGTTLQLAPPRIIASSSATEMVVAVGCLDGTIALLSTGIPTPNNNDKEPSVAGTVLE